MRIDRIFNLGYKKKEARITNLLDLFVELFTAFYDCER